MFNCFPVVIQSCCTIMDHKYLWKTYFSYLPNFVILRHPTTKLLAKHRGMSIFSQSMDTKLLTPFITPHWSPPSPPSSMLIYARHKCETGLKIWGINIEVGGRGVFKAINLYFEVKMVVLPTYFVVGCLKCHILEWWHWHVWFTPFYYRFKFWRKEFFSKIWEEYPYDDVVLWRHHCFLALA